MTDLAFVGRFDDGVIACVPCCEIRFSLGFNQKPQDWHNFYNQVFADPSVLAVIPYIAPSNWNQIGVRVRPNRDMASLKSMLEAALDATGGLVDC